MALRQRMVHPGWEWSEATALEVVKAARPPRRVQFRRGGDLAAVVEELVNVPYARLEAPVGAGKSTLVPRALAAATGALVFHVLPNRQLVGHLCSYLVKVAEVEGAAVRSQVEQYYGDPDSVPRSGVLMIAAVDLVDLMALRKGLTCYKGCSVFLDEAHEADAYTHVLRTLSLPMGAERLVMASATFDPEAVSPARATPGAVKMTSVELGPSDTWEIDAPGSPFYAATLKDGILVFVDSRAAAKRLEAAYRGFGLDVFRLTSSSSDAEVADAMRAIADVNGPLCAVLADYTYRSGFTFNVSRAVDTGTVAYYDAEPGSFRRVSRRMFEFERVQSAGRLGRVSGDAEYYYQAGPCPSVICDLEGVEREAAAYIFRCLGYRPDGVLAGAFMAKEGLPGGVDVRAALAGPYPLTYYVKHPAAAPVQVAAEAGSKVPPPSYGDSFGDGVPVGGCEKGPSGSSSSRQGRDSGYSEPDWGSVVDEVVHDGGSKELQADVYHVSQVRDGARRGVVATLSFPRGLESVRDFARKRSFSFAVSSLPREERIWAFNALLDRYNIVTAQVRGVKAAMLSMRGVDRPRDFAERARDLVAEITADHADAVACLRAAEVFSMASNWSEPYNGELESERAAADRVSSMLLGGPTPRGKDDLDSDLRESSALMEARSVEGERARGRGAVMFEGRKRELVLPAWLGLPSVAYEEYDKPGGGQVRELTMQRNTRRRDSNGDYHYVRRYKRITKYYDD